MNKRKKIAIAEIISIIAIILLGFLFHYLYEWTENELIALISPVNESYWEHIKIMFYPYVLVSIIEYFFIKDDVPNNYIFAKAMSVLVFIGITFTISLLYEGLIGHAPLVVHIIAYIIGALVGQLTSYKLLMNQEENGNKNVVGLIVFLILIVIITLFTFRPLHIDFFKDSTTGTYGISNES